MNELLQDIFYIFNKTIKLFFKSIFYIFFLKIIIIHYFISKYILYITSSSEE